MNTPTPTPRTDASTRTFLGSKIVFADFARQLEQELNEAKSWAKPSMESAVIAASTIAQLTQQRDEAMLRLNSTMRHIIVENDLLRKMLDAFAENGDCGDEWLMADYRELPHVRARKTK